MRIALATPLRNYGGEHWSLFWNELCATVWIRFPSLPDGMGPVNYAEQFTTKWGLILNFEAGYRKFQAKSNKSDTSTPEYTCCKAWEFGHWIFKLPPRLHERLNYENIRRQVWLDNPTCKHLVAVSGYRSVHRSTPSQERMTPLLTVLSFILLFLD